MTIEEVLVEDEYIEELPPDMNTERVGGHTHVYTAGISSGSSSSSSTASSSFGGDGHGHSHDAHMHTDSVCASYWNTKYIESISHLLKVIIEIYELHELKPLFVKLGLDYPADESLRKYINRFPDEFKKREKHLDDELFKI